MIKTAGRALAAVLVLMALGACGGTTGRASTPSSTRTAATSGSLRFVGPIGAVYTPGYPGSLLVAFRLNRLIGNDRQGNARISARLAGRRPEFVSRIARKRYRCYLTGPVDLTNAQAASGTPVQVILYASGQRLQGTATIKVESTAGALDPRPPRCHGRKEY